MSEINQINLKQSNLLNKNKNLMLNLTENTFTNNILVKNTNTQKIKTNLVYSIILTLLLSLTFALNTSDLYAKKKKKKRKKSRSARLYNPNKTKNEAILMIRANSEELAELIGATPIDKSQLPKHLFANHSELENLDEMVEENSEFDEEIAKLALMENESINDIKFADSKNPNANNELLTSNNTTAINYYDESKYEVDYFNFYDADGFSSNEDYYYEGDIIGDEGEDLEELSQYNEPSMTMEEFRNFWLSYVSSIEGKNIDDTESGIKKSEIMEIILSWFGTPYKFGGTSENAIDCSAFVQTVFNTAAEVKLPRTAREQFTVGKLVRNRKDLKFGDLVFFNTRKRVRVSHVGIYLGDNLFAHASSRSGVTVSSLEQDYYNRKYIGGKRIGLETMNQVSKIDKNASSN